jgi:mono/diheme cytochrome c family protein
MKKALKILGLVLALLLLVGFGFFGYVEATWEQNYSAFAEPKIKASKDPEVIRRGEYIVHAVAHCSVCHIPQDDARKRAAGARPDLVGGGEWNLPAFGYFCSANITPDPETGIGKMSDGQLARAIRHGLSREGKLLPFMSLAVGQMSDEDLTATVSYLRAQRPVKQAQPADRPGFLGKVVAKAMSPGGKTPPAYVPPGGISVERGQYLANGPAVCSGCHTPADPLKGFAPTGPPFSGEAHAEPDPSDAKMEFVTPNLTPDPETGHIAAWSEDAFVNRFRAGSAYEGTKMPWGNFIEMTEDDVRSIYRYLRTVPAVKHDVGPPRREAGWKPKAAK